MDARLPRPGHTETVAAAAKPPVERLLGLSMLAVFATTLCMRAVDPVVPQIAAHFVVDPHTVALLATAFSLPYAITQPVLGGLADAFGKTRLMTLSLGALMLSAALGAAAPDMPTLFASRVVSGIMAGGVFPIAVAIAADLVSFERRQVAVGRILSAAMIGNVLGSPLAGIAADLIGWRGVFVGMGALAGTAVVATGFGFRGLRTSAAERIEIASMPATYRAIFRHPLAKICFGSVMIEAICLHGLFPYVAQLLAAAGEPRAAIAGLVIAGFGVGGIIYVAMIALLLRLLHERGVMLTGGTLMGLGLMVVALRLPWPLQFVNFIVLGLGFYLLHGVIQIYASELAPQARGSAMAMHSTFFFFGNALGPVIYGLALSTLGLAATVIPFGTILIGVGIVCARTLRRDAR